VCGECINNIFIFFFRQLFFKKKTRNVGEKARKKKKKKKKNIRWCAGSAPVPRAALANNARDSLSVLDCVGEPRLGDPRLDDRKAVLETECADAAEPGQIDHGAPGRGRHPRAKAPVAARRYRVDSAGF
jgi:hypothetical protein